MKYNLLAVLALSVPLTLFSQEFRGTISGVVTDPSGASIPGAKVTVTEINTGTKLEAVTEPTGQYTAPLLLPGDYDIAVKTQGFKEAVRKGVHLGAGEHPVIDVQMAVGDTSLSIEVTADAPLVNSENASVGSTITTKDVEDLPLNGGSPWMLAQLEMGVIYSPFTGNDTSSGAMNTYDSSNNFSIAGTPTQSSEILLNGAPNSTWDMRSAYTPPKDAVQEVRAKVLDTDAAFGHTRGGTINMVLKSGTNSLHGSLYEFNKPSNLAANSFFNNAKGLGNPVTHFNQFGGSAGGPVRIPKLYDGRDKLFWFFAWQNDRNSTPNTNFLSVPTAAEKSGDFSQIQAVDGTQLYDPYSGVSGSGGTISRSPLPGNQIPASRINPIAAAYLKFFPTPNVVGVNATSLADGYFNYGTTAPNTNSADNEEGTLDYNMTERSRLSFNVRHNALFAKSRDYFQNLATGTIGSKENWGSSLDEVYALNANNILNLRLNYTFLYESNTDPSAGFDPTTLGFPAYLAGNSQRLALPYVYFDTSTAYQSLGTTGAAKRPSQSLQLSGSWTKLRGNHALRFGGEARQQRLSASTFGASVGSFNFGGNRWVNNNASSAAAEAMGQDMAQFLYGLPTQGSYDINTSGSWYSYYSAGYAQDDWRVKRNLTLNLGIHFDHEGPTYEKWGRTESGWAFDTPNPIAQAAIAAYNRNPIAQIPVGSFNVNGGLLYPNGKGAPYENTSHLVSPRVGIAWSPNRFGGKTVIRTGFGMFVAPIVISTLSQNGKYSTDPITDQQGFSQSTAMTPSTNNYVTPGPVTFSDPFPGGALLQPAGSSAGQATFLGQSIFFLNPNMKSPYSLRWNFGIQQSLSANMLLEVAYIGNHSVHTPINYTQLNGVPRQYLSTSPFRDPAVISAMTASVSNNPFNGLVTSGTPAGSKTTVSQLLATYPEFPLGYTSGTWSGSGGVIEQNLNAGSSYFHSLNVRFQRRFSKGLMVLGNYIYSKLMDETTWLNDTDPRPEKRVGVFDHTHRGVITVTYELPFKARSRSANLLVGGWHANAIYTRQTGQPFTFMGTSSQTIGDVVYLGAPLVFNPRETNGPAFNTSAFDTKTADQYSYHIRTFSTTFSSLRGDSTNQVDGSLLKRFDVAQEGKMYFQLRAEFFNLMNHPMFSFPNLAPTNSAFGLITATANRSRQVQLGGRFVF
ncbi:MAG: carboxypeptidase regulatory-like domain-containing protein [Acidobacteriia bacterium]|nr:carboxypeptidase regulatory-like domain-containing protein [Terriglobia bacterium]